MNILDKLEKKFGRYAIRNLMLYLTILYAAGFIIWILRPQFYYEYLSLDASMILRGQVWRLVTWLAYPPSTSAIFGVVMLYMYYVLGTSLARMMGDFRFNMFIITGVLLYIIAAFIFNAFGITLIFTPESLNMTIFLAFVFAFPDSVFLIFFIIPIKGKYLGIIYVVLELIGFITGNLAEKVSIGLALLNFVIFFYGFGMAGAFKANSIIRKARFMDAMKKREEAVAKMRPESRTVKHKCTICGITDNDDPEMEFRYCSKCGGNYEYCTEHLFTHEHIVDTNNGKDN